MTKEQHPFGLTKHFSTTTLEDQLTRLDGQLQVFRAVEVPTGPDRQNKLEKAEKYYEEHKAVIVPASVDRWAVSQNQDVPKARQTTLIEIFNRDIQIAHRFESGAVQGSSLSALIETTEKDIKQTINTLDRRAI